MPAGHGSRAGYVSRSVPWITALQNLSIQIPDEPPVNRAHFLVEIAKIFRLTQ